MGRTLRGHADTSRALADLAQGTAVLHLSVETPARVPGWDAILLTAASERQARLYEMQIEAARRRGLIGEATRTLVVPDPQGRRIGSGGATLNALRRMAEVVGGAAAAASMKVLLIHAGGDSRRVPWANIPGKSFIPFPLLTDVDRPVNTIFDHQLAMAAPVAAAMHGGGLLSFAGDALPLFDAIALSLPRDGGVVVTSPVSLDVAGKHGVIVAGADGHVAELVQKATPERLVERGALVRGCAALLDTGIYAFCGRVFDGLLSVACASPDPVEELLASGQECSLYEEIASALVPACRPWLEGRPLGRRLLAGLGAGALPLLNHVADDLLFVHFGTTSEVLDHLAASWNGELSRRILVECGGGVDATASVYASRLGDETVVGRGSLVYGCRLGDGVRVGSRCVVLGVDLPAGALRVPDNTCLWQAPLDAAPAVATVCCGVDDNPKDVLGRATFVNRDLRAWMASHGVGEADLWPGGGDRSLWRAKVIPVDGNDDLRLTGWVLGDGPDADAREAWLRARRLSLADLHMAADPAAFIRRHDGVVEDLVLRAVKRTLRGGGERNVHALASQATSAAARAELGRLSTGIAEEASTSATTAPRSRTLRMKADLARAAGRVSEAEALQQRSFEAVHSEVAAAIADPATRAVSDLPTGKTARVDLPVRFDVAGGWSDTPPYCLERPAKVLNMAMCLNGERPVGASVEALGQARWELEIADDGSRSVVHDGEPVLDPAGLSDRFALLRTALVLCGYGSGRHVTQGVRVRTWSRVPRGSGLGTSSILAAALVSALEQLAGRSTAPERVIDLVLILEQRLTTGGGWQDQVGGLVPGIKLVSSLPVQPLRIGVEPVPLLASVADELQARMVLAFTGIDRLAKNVLQIVVGRYLRRDGRTLGAIADLVALAEEGKRALALGDLDGLGAVMTRAWQIHQVLDAHCSSAAVDALFDRVADLAVGAKLAGAGGGGFLGVLAKDAEAAVRVRQRLAEANATLKVYDWTLA